MKPMQHQVLLLLLLLLLQEVQEEVEASKQFNFSLRFDSAHEKCDRYVPPSRRGAGGMSDAQARVSGGDMMPDRR